MNNYVKNLKAIKSRTKDFANLITKNKNPIDWAEKIEAENGDSNVIIRTAGKPILVYDNSDPKEEIKKKVQLLDLDSDVVSVIVGAGNGYLVNEILTTMHDKHVVVLIEPVMDLLKIALSENDFSRMIERGSLLFAVTCDDIDYQLGLIENLKNVKNWYIITEDYTKSRPAEYRDLANHVFVMINQLRNNTSTTVGAGRIMALNDVSSLPYIIRHRGVKELENLYKDKPAILVSTGPSLQKNIHLLAPKEVQERFIIIAAGQAYRALLAYDIKPDFVCSVDFGPVNWGHYKGLLEIQDDIPLIAINRTYQPIMKHWKGPKFISTTLDGANSGTITELIQTKGGLLQGGSVSHMNFGLAIAMGCDPIILIGQDLGWEDDLSHSPLMDEAGKVELNEDGTTNWKVHDPRSEIQGQHNMGITQKINGYYGKPVNTMSCYISYLATFERMFRSIPDKAFINATEGGAKIEGAKQLTLQEVIETYKDKIDKSKIKPLLSFADNKDTLISESIKIIKNDLKELDEIIRLSNESLHILIRMKGKNKRRDAFARRIKKNYETTIKIRELSNKNPLIAISIFWAAKAITHKQYSDARHEMKEKLDIKNTKHEKLDYFYTKEGREVLKTRINANEIIVKAAKEAAEILEEEYKKALEEIEYLKENGELKEFESMNPPPSLDDVNTYYKNENWAYPLIEARRILSNTLHHPMWEIRAAKVVEKECLEFRQRAINKANWDYDRLGKDKIIKYNELIEKAHEEGRNQRGLEPKERNFEKAFDYLKQAFKFDKERPEALWGLATTYHGLGDSERKEGNHKKADEYQADSIRIYNDLVNKYPENTRFKFELALVYLRIGLGKEADEIYKILFAETNEYDFFLKSLARLYLKAGMLEEAKTAIEHYIEKFPFDPKGKEVLNNILSKQ